MGRLNKYKEWYNKKIGQKEKVQKDITNYKQELKLKKKELKRKEKALELVKTAAMNTQKQLEYHISTVVTTALNAVFEQPYGFEIEFVDKRGKTECNLWFVKNGHRVDPFYGSGLGAVDIAAFALRVACLSMSGLRPVLLLDEPFKHLKGEEPNQKAIQMMNTVSKETTIQIITISDERAVIGDIISGADKVFQVSQNKKGISKIKEITC